MMELKKYRYFLDQVESTQKRIDEAKRALKRFSPENDSKEYLKAFIVIQQGTCKPDEVEVDVNSAGIEGALRNALAKDEYTLNEMQKKLDVLGL